MFWGIKLQHTIVCVLLLLCLGAESCNPPPQSCEDDMDQVPYLPTAELRCSGAKAYLGCVQTSIKDCTNNEFTDQYALNIVDLYCSKAYMCAVDLRKCYSKFSDAVRNSIKRSDLSQRVTICRDLMSEIMTCQENVTSRCQSQAGLMETVKSSQKEIAMVCNDTGPCSTMVLMCHKSIIDIGNGENTAPPTDDNNDDDGDDDGDNDGDNNALSECDRQKPIDYCGAYRQVASCIRDGMASCGGNMTLDYTLQNVDNTLSQQCDPQSICGQKVSGCMCYINKQDLTSPLAIMKTICSTYPAFERCLDNIGEECYALDRTRQEIAEVKYTYLRYHKLYCTTREGLCPEALQCLVKIPQDVLAPSSSSPLYPVSTFHINTLCLGVDTFFRCLETEAAHCIRATNDVTMADIEESLMLMCADMESHRSEIRTCGAVTTCLEDFHLSQLGQSSFDDFGKSDDDSRKIYGGITSTEYWCKYLTHSYQCIEEAGAACALSDQLIAESILRRQSLHQVCEGPTTTAPTETQTSKPNNVKTRPSKENGSARVHSTWWTATLLLLHTLCLRH